MRDWRHTKLGGWFWRNYWHKVQWLCHEREFYKWVKFAKKHNIWVTITDEYIDRMIEKGEKLRRLKNLFRPYDKWER